MSTPARPKPLASERHRRQRRRLAFIAATIAALITLVGAASGAPVQPLSDEQSHAATCGHLGVSCDAREPRRALRVQVHPVRARAGQPTRFQLRVARRADGRPVRGATVRFAGRTRRTNAHGRTSVVVRFASPGRRAVGARAQGTRSARAYVSVAR